MWEVGCINWPPIETLKLTFAVIFTPHLCLESFVCKARFPPMRQNLKDSKSKSLMNKVSRGILEWEVYKI